MESRRALELIEYRGLPGSASAGLDHLDSDGALGVALSIIHTEALVVVGESCAIGLSEGFFVGFARRLLTLALNVGFFV